MDELFSQVAFWIGVTVIAVSTVGVFGLSLCSAADFICKKYSSTWMAALYWWNRKAFHKWCRENRDQLNEVGRAIADKYVDQHARDAGEGE